MRNTEGIVIYKLWLHFYTVVCEHIYFPLITWVALLALVKGLANTERKLRSQYNNWYMYTGLEIEIILHQTGEQASSKFYRTPERFTRPHIFAVYFFYLFIFKCKMNESDFFTSHWGQWSGWIYRTSRKNSGGPARISSPVYIQDTQDRYKL